MGNLHIERVKENVDIARWYHGEGQADFEADRPFKTVATLLWDGRRVEVWGLHGVMTRSMWEEFVVALVGMGAVEATGQRRHKTVTWSLA